MIAFEIPQEHTGTRYRRKQFQFDDPSFSVQVYLSSKAHAAMLIAHTRFASTLWVSLLFTNTHLPYSLCCFCAELLSADFAPFVNTLFINLLKVKTLALLAMC